MIPTTNRPLRVIFFRTEGGNEPVREWLKQLPQEERKSIGEDIKTVQFRWPLGMPLVRPVGDGIHEVRTGLPHRVARTLFFVHAETVVLLHAFIKKTRQTPADELVLARRRKRDYLKIYD
jgi:phage-related protein